MDGRKLFFQLGAAVVALYLAMLVCQVVTLALADARAAAILGGQ